MVKQAEQFAAADQKRKEEVEIRNLLTMRFTVQRGFKRNLAAKITKDQSEKLTKSIATLREALSGKDIDPIKQRMEDLQKVLQEIGTAAYQNVANNSTTDFFNQAQTGTTRRKQERRR